MNVAEEFEALAKFFESFEKERKDGNIRINTTSLDTLDDTDDLKQDLNNLSKNNDQSDSAYVEKILDPKYDHKLTSVKATLNTLSGESGSIGDKKV